MAEMNFVLLLLLACFQGVVFLTTTWRYTHVLQLLQQWRCHYESATKRDSVSNETRTVADMATSVVADEQLAECLASEYPDIPIDVFKRVLQRYRATGTTRV